MKTIIFQRVMCIFGLLILSVIFLACPDVPQVLEQQKSKVTFIVVDNAARTVFPQTSLSDVAFYKLLGGRNGVAETVLVESFTGTGTSVTLEPGTWNFTLNAYNDSGANILQGKVQNKQINLTGTNQVSFSLSVINSGMGSIQITLNFPEVAGITRISTTGDADSENFTPNNGGKFIYDKNGIVAGDYFINFELYRGDVLRTVISELVLVRNGLTSSKTITLVGEDLKPVYLTGTVTINSTVSIIGTELTAIYNGTETVAYQWNKDGSAIEDATEAKYTPNSTGSYTVTVSVAGYSNSLNSTAVAVVGSTADVPGYNLQTKLEWLKNNAESNSNYILEVSGNETIPSFTLSYPGKSNIVITLISTGLRYTITSSDTMFNVRGRIILVLDNNITLQRTTSGGTLVSVNGTLVMNTGSAITKGRVDVDGGTFTMYGGTISGNTNNNPSSNPTFSGGGIYVKNGGTFTMSGGTISGNTADSGFFRPSSSYYYWSYGGGVNVVSGTFIMSGGTISGNTASSSFPSSNNDSHGGGVYVGGSGTFTMSGGTITNNTASSSSSSSRGGGVFVYSSGTFTMSGGKISGNTASSDDDSRGGGVYVDNNGTLTMKGGEISGNTTTTISSSSNSPNSSGGGVFVGIDGIFTMSDGTISGNISSSSSSSSFSYGGGVSFGGETFTMNGGEISGNKVSSNHYSYGGGVSFSGGTFTMNGGKISGNTVSVTNTVSSSSISSYGGGVSVGSGTFTMKGGEISGNTISSSTPSSGGGVSVGSGTFTMKGGKISGNTVSSSTTTSRGGGVSVGGGTFTMIDGTISGNTNSCSSSSLFLRSYGGGVFVAGIFTKTGGTVNGYSADNNNSNVVTGNYYSGGSAVYVDSSPVKRRESTAGPAVNMDSAVAGTAGGWE